MVNEFSISLVVISCPVKNRRVINVVSVRRNSIKITSFCIVLKQNINKKYDYILIISSHQLFIVIRK